MKKIQLIMMASAVASLTSLTAQAQYSNPFNTTSSPFRFDYGTTTASTTATTTWVSGPTYDAGGSALSGSAKLSWTWNHTADGDGGAAFTADLFGTDQNYAGSTLSFDIMVDPNSVAGGFNDYGYFQVFDRDDGYAGGPGMLNESLVGGVATTVGTWAHVSVVLGADASTLRALTFQDYNDAGRSINGPETIYIDNLTLTPVPEPSTIALAGFGGIAALLAIRRNRKS